MPSTPAARDDGPDGNAGTSRFISAPDGLRLHVRIYGPAAAQARPVVCLPGLTRNSSDFHEIAMALANDPACPRRVVALDARGRGRSDYDDDPANYTLATELADVIAVATALEIAGAVFIGTSRGGLLTMLLAAVRPSFLAGAVLNDIGPAVEMAGLLRLKSYVGRLPAPRDFSDAADILERAGRRFFPKLTAEDWLCQARRTWKEDAGRLVLDYDARLAETLSSVDPATPVPTLWPQFDALADIPLMAIRGANSDLLSAATLAAMSARRPDLITCEVADEGHPPLLRGAVLQAVTTFVRRCDADA